MKRKYILVIINVIVVVIVLAICTVLFFASRTSQTSIDPEREQGCLGIMPLDSMPQFAFLRPGLRFKIDTGSDVSTITEHDRLLLDSLGYKARKSFYPAVGRDGIGDIVFESTRYTIDLPFYDWTITTDSLGNLVRECNYSAVNVISGVDFMPAETEFSVIGIDFLEKFYLEFHHDTNSYRLYLEEPEGYEKCSDMKISHDLTFWPMLGHRYYIPATASSINKDFFLDTGLQRAYIKCCAADMPSEHPSFVQDTIASFRGRFPGYADPAGWLIIGDREGSARVNYYDNDEEAYAINPLNMFVNLDILFDFPGRHLSFRHTSFNK
ncbi:MAG: hypothetical protein NC111_06145 [Bacteroides sp.]|nr:hypothetical protein [Bacteroides sp.]MCM1413170.1 hypothetical protein [Bacteroides sp.]MCM1472088.1 hypothetical protein [Bacteroides sp.]